MESDGRGRVRKGDGHANELDANPRPCHSRRAGFAGPRRGSSACADRFGQIRRLYDLPVARQGRSRRRRLEIVKNLGDAKTLDNLAIRCLEESRARKDGYSFTGTCVETDADGDKIYMTYEGPESGPLQWVGGTGKFKDVSGKGAWSVTDAPGNTPDLFAFTLDFNVEWRTK
jgi:hypothetical protein